MTADNHNHNKTNHGLLFESLILHFLVKLIKKIEVEPLHLIWKYCEKYVPREKKRNITFFSSQLIYDDTQPWPHLFTIWEPIT